MLTTTLRARSVKAVHAVGSVSPAAVNRLNTRKLVDGSVGSSSTLGRGVSLRPAGAVVPAGLVTKGLARRFTGSLTPAGALNRIRVFIRNFAGSVTPGGALRRQWSLRKAGTVTPASVVRRAFALRKTGAVTPAAAFKTQFFHRIYGRSATVTIRVSTPGEATAFAYLRTRVDLTAATVADVLYPGQYIWDAKGAVVRSTRVPDPPTGVSATAGFQQAVVYFAPPVEDGGSPILDYEVIASTGQTATGPMSPITVGGLTNGTSVSFVVFARNVQGPSLSSTPSPPVVPQAGVPEAPRELVLVPGNGQVTASWLAPANTGGSALTGYVLSLSTGQTISNIASSPRVVTGLTNGVPVTATVSAVSAAGTSAPSVRSAAVTPATVPGAPTIGTPTPGSGQITARWTAPSNNGGVAVTSYQVVAYVGSTSTVAADATVSSGTATELTVSGLTNGTGYQVAVRAFNAMGASVYSARSATVTPVGAAITTRVAKTTFNDGAGITLFKPNGTVPGDVMIANFTVRVYEVTTVPEGWTLVPGASGYVDNTAFYVYYKVATVDDAAITQWRWLFDGFDYHAGGIQSYVGVSNTTPIDKPAVVVTGYRSTFTATYQPTHNSGMLVGCVQLDADTGVNPPSGWTEDYELRWYRSAEQSHAAYTGTSSGSYTWTLSSNDSAGVVLFALRSA